MKRLTNGIMVLFVPILLSMIACNNGEKVVEFGDEPASSHNETRSQRDSLNHLRRNDTDQEVIDYLLPKNADEIAWLSAGIKNGSNPSVMVQANMMLPEHLALAEKLKTIINEKGFVSPLSYPGENSVSINKKGKEWDKAWADRILKDHIEIVEKLAKAEITAKDKDLRKLVKDTRPIAARHLEMARMLISKLN